MLGPLEPFWTAVSFLMVGLLLIVVEIWMPGYFIAVPGGALVLGGALALAFPVVMFDSAWAWLLWPLFLGIASLANLYAYKRWAPPGHAPLTMGGDSLPGEVGTVQKEILADHPGQVRIKGAMWSARSESGHIGVGSKVRVVRVDGVYAIVEQVTG